LFTGPIAEESFDEIFKHFRTEFRIGHFPLADDLCIELLVSAFLAAALDDEGDSDACNHCPDPREKPGKGFKPALEATLVLHGSPTGF
jgi:hypothetical protein